MSKILENPRQTRVSERENAFGQPVGLSSCPNLTEPVLVDAYVKQHRNGEGSINIRCNSRGFRVHKPPRNEGERLHKNGMSQRTKSKIKTSVRMLGAVADYFKMRKVFITLTYGMQYPDDKISKIHLDKFHKRMTRYFKLQQLTWIYIWVSERQKRGAIHYHIFSINYLPKEVLNKHWNQVVNAWLLENGYEPQEVYPHIEAVDNPGRYMSKYLIKGVDAIRGNIYGMSEIARMLTKPVYQNVFRFDYKYALIKLHEWIEQARELDERCFVKKTGDIQCHIWMSKNVIPFAEFLNSK